MVDFMFLLKNIENKIEKTLILLFILSVSVFSTGCWDKPLLTELATNRLEVRLKGTYSSNDPRPADLNTIVDDSVDDKSAADDYPTTFMLDIAEMRLDGGGDGESKFSIYRQTFSIPVNDSSDFFNGNGIVFDNDDVEPGRTYTTLKLYVRKMIFDNATTYDVSDSTGWALHVYDKNDPDSNGKTKVTFEEQDVYGFDYNQLQVNSFYDSLRLEASDINHVFPIHIPIVGGLTFDNNKEKTVLEIRLVIKNFIKKYEYDNFDDETPGVYHYYALSDWLRDVRAGEKPIGGNIHAVARAYVPGETGSISGDNNSGNDSYVMAIPTSDLVLGDYFSSPLRTTHVTNCNVPFPPSVTATSINAVLDYFLKYEKYKSDWENGIAGSFDKANCDQAAFESEWTMYENAAKDFKIPPCAVFVADGSSYNIQNIAPGTYNLYYFTAPAYGSMLSVAPNSLATDVVVTSGSTATYDF